MIRPLIALALLGAWSSAQTIDFETFPDGTPMSEPPPPGLLQISAQYEEAYGVTFVLANGQFPVIAKVGCPQTAFVGVSGSGCGPSPPPCPTMTTNDDDRHAGLTLVPGTNCASSTPEDFGCFFLTDDGVVSGLPTNLTIQYSTPVPTASGSILDIDQNEKWRVRAFDSSGTQIGADIVLDHCPTAADGNGKGQRWSFPATAQGISRIDLVYDGGAGNIGLAFDNFSPSSPTPCDGSFAFYGAGVPGSGGQLPKITLLGCPEAGQSVTLRTWNALGAALGCLAVGTSPASIPAFGGQILVGIDAAFSHTASGTTGVTGDGTYSLGMVVPASPVVVGSHVYFQAGYCDPGAALGFSLTRGLDVTVGP